MAKRRKYDPTVKAQVLAALLTSQGAEKVAQQYQIPVGTVRGWKAKAKADDGVVTQKKKRDREITARISGGVALYVEEAGRVFRG